MFVHQAAVYESDDEFLELVLPLLREGIEADEPTFVGVEPRRESLIRDEVGEPPALTYLARCEDPLAALRANLELFEAQAAKGCSGTVRIVSETFTPSDAGRWDGWGRYEAVANHFYAELPVHSLCPFHRPSTPPDVLDDVMRTHPALLTAGGVVTKNDNYLEPSLYLSERAAPEIDTLEQTSPQLVRRNPSLIDAREAVGVLARASGLDDEQTFGLVLAVNEAIANASAHGQPPTELRAWTADDRVVVAVRDRGAGPPSPFVGLVRGASEGRLGLWLSNQLCSRVTLTSDDYGFTVHLVAGVAQPLRRAAA